MMLKTLMVMFLLIPFQLALAVPQTGNLNTPLCNSPSFNDSVSLFDLDNIKLNACILAGGRRVNDSDSQTILNLAEQVLAIADSSQAGWQDNPNVQSAIAELIDSINVARMNQLRTLPNPSMSQAESLLANTLSTTYSDPCKRGSHSEACLEKLSRAGDAAYRRTARMFEQWDKAERRFRENDALARIPGSSHQRNFPNGRELSEEDMAIFGNVQDFYPGDCTQESSTPGQECIRIRSENPPRWCIAPSGQVRSQHTSNPRCHRGAISQEKLTEALSLARQRERPGFLAKRDQLYRRHRTSQRQRFNRYMTFIKNTAINNSTTAAKEWQDFEARSQQSPFNGYEIRPLTAAMRARGESGGARPGPADAQGRRKILLYMDPDDDPIQTISTFAHETHHGSQFNQQMIDHKKTVESNSIEYKRLYKLNEGYSKIHNFFKDNVCYASTQANCESGACIEGGDGPDSSSTICQSGGNYRLRPAGTTPKAVGTSARCAQDSYFCRDQAQEEYNAVLSKKRAVAENMCLTLRDNVRAYPSNQGCVFPNEGQMDSAISAAKAKMAALSSAAKSTAADQAVQVDGQTFSRADIMAMNAVRSMSGWDNTLKLYPAEKIAARTRLEFLDGTLNTNALYGLSNANSFMNVRRQFATLRGSYDPATRYLAKDALLDEYKAYSLTVQTQADLAVNFPNLACQRLSHHFDKDRKSRNIASLFNSMNNDLLCGRLLCSMIAVPYTKLNGGVGSFTTERDVFTGNSWNIRPDILTAVREWDQGQSNDSHVGGQAWSRPLNQCPGSSTNKPVSGDCSGQVPSGRQPVRRSY